MHARSSLAVILSKPVALDLLDFNNIEKTLDDFTVFIVILEIKSTVKRT